MTNIFIIHGAYGNPEENWFPWLKVELEKINCKVFIPEFPTPENQSLTTWLNVFEEYNQYVDENSIFVGHSLGPAFILNILEKIEKPVKACFFASGWIGLLGNPYFDKINKTLVDKKFDWRIIKQNCKKFFIFYSDNDPYVSLKKSEELSRNLGTEAILVKNAGHFNKETGYSKFELLLKEIKNSL